jgi:hypothetical protein
LFETYLTQPPYLPISSSIRQNPAIFIRILDFSCRSEFQTLAVMPPGDDYKEWQDRYDDLNEEGRKNQDLADDDPNKWTTTEERNHAEDMRVAASL